MSEELLELVAEGAENLLLIIFRVVILGAEDLLDIGACIFHEIQLILLIIQPLRHDIIVIILLIVLPGEVLDVLVVFVTWVAYFED